MERSEKGNMILEQKSERKKALMSEMRQPNRVILYYLSPNQQMTPLKLKALIFPTVKWSRNQSKETGKRNVGTYTISTAKMSEILVDVETTLIYSPMMHENPSKLPTLMNAGSIFLTLCDIM